MIQAVFFDLYGTLVDVSTNEQELPPYERLAEWLGDRKIRANPAALQKLYTEGVAKLKTALTEPDMEIDIRAVFQGMLKSLGVAKPQAPLIEDFGWAFRRYTRTKCHPIAGANDLLQKLKSEFRLGLVGDAQKIFTMRELEELRMVEPFETIILSSETGYRKPSTKMFEVVLQALEVAPEEAIFVGDSLREDIAGAKAAGIRTLHYCPGGPPPADGGPEPDGRVKKLAEVSKFVENWQEPMENPLVDEIMDEED